MNKFFNHLFARIRKQVELFGIAQFSLFVPKKEKGKKNSPPNIKTPLPRGVKPKINRHEQHK